jgi:hypothetical protein
LTAPYEPFDIAVIGVPFDTAVTYRPGKVFFVFGSFQNFGGKRAGGAALVV